MCQKLIILLCVLFSPTYLLAKSKNVPFKQNYETPYIPRFVTGSLLAPTPINMEIGHPAIEPIFIFSSTYGKYEKNWGFTHTKTTWAINPSLDFQLAITESIGLELYPAYISNFQENKSFSHFQDTNVFIGYQISRSQEKSWIPNFRTDLHLIFPTGNYQKLDPNLNGIDSTGQGAYQLGPTLIANKLFKFNSHFLSITGSIGYLYAISINIKGYNTYGGASGTKGKVKPGNAWLFFLSGELSLTQNWALAGDLFIITQGSSSFSGIKGRLPSGMEPQLDLANSAQISVTPSIEYNFTDNLGMLFGSWLTVGGNNSTAFASIFASMVYIF